MDNIWQVCWAAFFPQSFDMFWYLRTSWGSRRPHECIDAFFVDLTLESCAAVREAKQKVASKWQSSFDAKGQVKPRVRIARSFKHVAEKVKVMGQKVKTKTKHAEKTDEAKTKPAVIKTKLKKSIKAPKKPEKGEEAVEGAYTRSIKGNKLIKQKLQSLLEMDQVAFPARPMFDGESKLCRLKCLGWSCLAHLSIFSICFNYLFIFPINVLFGIWKKTRDSLRQHQKDSGQHPKELGINCCAWARLFSEASFLLGTANYGISRSRGIWTWSVHSWRVLHLWEQRGVGLWLHFATCRKHRRERCILHPRGTVHKCAQRSFDHNTKDNKSVTWRYMKN